MSGERAAAARSSLSTAHQGGSMPELKKVKVIKVKREVKTRVAVSETNLRRAAARLLATKLVSTEVAYVRRVLGASATQEDLDANVLAVRKLPWSSIVVPD
jgi:hypothetical protein